MFCDDTSNSNVEMTTGTAVRQMRGAHSGDTEDLGSNITSDILRYREGSKLFRKECQRSSWIVGKVGPDVSKDRNTLRWRYYYFSKRRDLLARWKIVTFQDTQITITINTVRISDVSNSNLCPKDLNTFIQSVLQDSQNCEYIRTFRAN